MTFIRKLAGALFLAFFCSAYSNAQDLATGQLDPTQVYSTPNLVIPTIQGSGSTPWVNGVYQDSLSCWAWGNPGYCGPNPIVRPGDNINFSFGMTNLYQMQAISSVLPNSGTGLRVNGYNFGFIAKNGNGWDNGQVDYLNAYVSFYDPKGSVVYNKNYNLNYQFDWTSFNYSENFLTPYASKDLGSVQYGFVGGDSNFWAGPYGPEIYNISFNLKFSVDTCYINVLSSPSCPGYLEELAKLNPISSTTEATVETSPTTSTSITTDPVAPVTVAYSSPVSSSPATTTSSTPATTSTPVAAERASSGPSLSTILGIVRAEQSRISAVESATVSQANETAAQAASTATQTAESVAQTAVQNSQNQQTLQSQNNNASAGISLTAGSGSVVNIGALRGPEIIQSSSETQTSSSQIGIQLGSGIGLSLRNIESRQAQEIDIPRLATIDFSGRSPIKDYLEEKPVINQEPPQTSQRQPEVKRNVPNNEAAGEVTIAAIAKMPPGFELYQMGMKDTVFYAPKEIYKNQKVIDNERVLRQLNGRSDRIHEEMVNEQYKN